VTKISQSPSLLPPAAQDSLRRGAATLGYLSLTTLNGGIRQDRTSLQGRLQQPVAGFGRPKGDSCLARRWATQMAAIFELTATDTKRPSVVRVASWREVACYESWLICRCVADG
jgi:hypothetical protein